VAIAPPKNMDRLEWFLEKSVEIGIHSISFIRCQNSERNTMKTDRLYKKAVSALKQSGNFFFPEISELVNFKDFIMNLSDQEENRTRKYIAHAETGAGNLLMKVAGSNSYNIVLIGPEGDFSAQELKMASEAGFIPVSLGPARLRTETAGLVACITIHLINA
jgi:16S rRNA (uracil1498-N3)-methyltransferase